MDRLEKYNINENLKNKITELCQQERELCINTFCDITDEYIAYENLLIDLLIHENEPEAISVDDIKKSVKEYNKTDVAGEAYFKILNEFSLQFTLPINMNVVSRHADFNIKMESFLNELIKFEDITKFNSYFPELNDKLYERLFKYVEEKNTLFDCNDMEKFLETIDEFTTEDNFHIFQTEISDLIFNEELDDDIQELLQEYIVDKCEEFDLTKRDINKKLHQFINQGSTYSRDY